LSYLIEGELSMNSLKILFASCILLWGPVTTVARAAAPAADTTDPYLWLEEREGEKSLEWVRAQDTATAAELCADSNFARFREDVLAIVNAEDRIPFGTLRGDYVYNFWQDADHVRGIYRRTSLAEYAKPDPAWETVLDIDSLNAAEGKSWVYKETSMLPP
jgi:prolyl oligopeptidase